MSYERFINEVSSRRKVSLLREITKMYATAPAGTIFMAGGVPNASTIPFTRVEVQVGPDLTLALEGKKLTVALQYQVTQGYGRLLEQLKSLQTRVHGLESKFWDSNDLMVTVGTLDGICKSVEMCMEVGDPVLFQDPSYFGVTDMFRPYKPRLIPISQDEFGMNPAKLRAALQAEGTPEQIRSKNRGVPKLLYVNPIGSNPTGATIPADRKKEIYQLACEYDLLILEDDPYYFLRFDEESPASFMSMDTEGRVLRFDSLSKVMSSGIRLGFVTGPRELVRRIEVHMQVSVMHASALPQVLVSTLLDEWKDEGLDAHFRFIRKFYKKQLDAMINAAHKHLIGLADWTAPKAGMFLWLRVRGVSDVRRMVMEGGVARGVILVPGHAFMVDTEAPCPYIRISFSTCTEQDMHTGFSRLADLIKQEMKRQDG